MNWDQIISRLDDITPSCPFSPKNKLLLVLFFHDYICFLELFILQLVISSTVLFCLDYALKKNSFHLIPTILLAFSFKLWAGSPKKWLWMCFVFSIPGQERHMLHAQNLTLLCFSLPCLYDKELTGLRELNPREL